MALERAAPTTNGHLGAWVGKLWEVQAESANQQHTLVLQVGRPGVCFSTQRLGIGGCNVHCLTNYPSHARGHGRSVGLHQGGGL